MKRRALLLSLAGAVAAAALPAWLPVPTPDPRPVAYVPASWTAEQISEFREWFDAVLGGQCRRALDLRVVQPGVPLPLSDLPARPFVWVWGGEVLLV